MKEEKKAVTGESKASCADQTRSTLAGLRNRLLGVQEACELCVDYLDNPKKWRVVASHIEDMQNDLETAEQQINELL